MLDNNFSYTRYLNRQALKPPRLYYNRIIHYKDGANHNLWIMSPMLYILRHTRANNNNNNITATFVIPLCDLTLLDELLT